MLNIENIDEKFYTTLNGDSWIEFQNKFNDCDDIFILGHGGNLAVADHAAIDITRLSNGTKNAQSPGSATVVTSLINDTNFDQWMVQWLKHVTSTKTEAQMKRCLIYGISSSGESRDLIKAFQWGHANGLQLGCVTAKPLTERIPKLTEVVLDCEYYHTAEVLSLLLQYQLTHGSGKVCPPIGGNKPEDIAHYSTQEIREHSFPDETKNICVDFDGVIHKNSKGYHDGTVYDEPVEGSKEALKKLSKKYDVVICSAKAISDRGLVTGKTGTQLVWEWLKKYKMDKFVTKVTAEKPRAVLYVDDKGLKFDNWNEALGEILPGEKITDKDSALYVYDSNVVNVLKDDGVEDTNWEILQKYENQTTVSLEQLRSDLGSGSWAVRLAYNDLFGGVVIQQHPGEGNRKHMHTEADENWVILDGVWEWWIDGKGESTVKKGDFVYVPNNTWHQITCIEGPAVRYAITKPDVEHIYLPEDMNGES